MPEDVNRLTLPVLLKIRDLVAGGATIVAPRPGNSPSLSRYSEDDERIRSIANEVRDSRARAQEARNLKFYNTFPVRSYRIFCLNNSTSETVSLHLIGLDMGHQDILESDEELIPILRVSVAISIQLIVFAYSAESKYRSPIVGVFLALYILYGIGLYFSAKRSDRFATNLKSWAHWIDVVWYLVLILLSGGGSSIFFVGFLFPIIVASFRWGFVHGLRVAIVSVLSFVAVSAIPAPGLEPGFELKLVLLKSAGLLGLSYLLAHWGEADLRLRRRLGLIGAFVSYSNPRFGIGRTISYVLDNLKDFYGAQSALIILANSDGEGYRLHHPSSLDERQDADPHTISADSVRSLLGLSPEHAAVHNARPEGWWHFGTEDQLLDITINRATKVERSTFENLEAILKSKAFVTVPVIFHGEGIGRLYLGADKPVFIASDMLFLLRILNHVNPIIENIRLVEQLASHAADDERRKIARDIHDNVIQPYFGIQMGLAAISAQVGETSPLLSNKIKRLMEMADTGINDLRRYIGGLKESEESEGGLLPAMRRFAAKFSEATGIAVDVETEGDVQINQRLAAETFQMMTEGLNNIRKHTNTTRAKVRISCRVGDLVLNITSESSRGKAIPFIPISITERAAALGGRVRVVALADGGSSVIVEIPL